MSRALLSQDTLLTLNTNKNNIIDVPGSARANTHLLLHVPSLSAKVNTKNLEYDQDDSLVSFEVVADGTPSSDPDAGEGTTARPVSAPAMCTAVLSLPRHHPKAVLSPLVRAFALLLSVFHPVSLSLYCRETTRRSSLCSPR